MGFSVSGAAAIVFTGMFIAFGVWYGASYNSFERISDAQHDRSERILETQNLEVGVVTAEYSVNTLTVEVDNTGAEAVALNATDVLVDNEYETDWREDATVDGDTETWLWQPGERLYVEFTKTTQPTHVRVTTERGVADSMEVT